MGESSSRLLIGDAWYFDITLEKIDPEAAPLSEIAILEEHGKAPAQYPEWDEDEDW